MVHNEKGELSEFLTEEDGNHKWKVLFNEYEKMSMKRKYYICIFFPIDLKKPRTL